MTTEDKLEDRHKSQLERQKTREVKKKNGTKKDIAH